MIVTDVLGYNDLNSTQCVIANDNVLIINKYVVEFHSLLYSQIKTQYSFDQFKENFCLLSFQKHNDKIYLLSINNGSSLIFLFEEDTLSFKQVSQLNQKSLQFLVYTHDKYQNYIFLTINYQLFQVFDTQVEQIKTDFVKELINQDLHSFLILDNNFVDLDKIYQNNTPFPSTIKQILFIDKYLYVLLDNNHIYQISPQQSPILLLDYEYIQFPICRIFQFHGILFFITEKNKLYFYDDKKIINVANIHFIHLQKLIFTQQYQEKILLISNEGIYAIFDPQKKQIVLSNVEQSQSQLSYLMNKQKEQFQIMNYNQMSQFKGFIRQGFWQIIANNGSQEFLFQNFEKQNKCSTINLNNQINFANAQLISVTEISKTLYIYYTNDCITVYQIKIQGKTKVTKQYLCQTQITKLFQCNSQDQILVQDLNNTLYSLDFTNLIFQDIYMSFKDNISFINEQSVYTIISVSNQLLILKNKQIVNIFRLTEVASSSYIINPQDHIGHQVIVISYDNGIIELRHLISFTLLHRISILLRKLSQLTIVNQQIICEDADTKQIYILDKLNQIDTLLLDNDLV